MMGDPVAERIAGERLLQLGYGADIAGVNFCNRGDGFAEQHADVREALRCASRVVLDVGIIFEHAGHHFVIGNAPGERVGDRFEDEQRQRLAVGDFARDLGAIGALALHFAAVRRRGHVGHQEIQQ